MEGRLADLDAGDIETLVTETNRLAPTGDPAHQTAKALAYVKTNAHRGVCDTNVGFSGLMMMNDCVLKPGTPVRTARSSEMG